MRKVGYPDSRRPSSNGRARPGLERRALRPYSQPSAAELETRARIAARRSVARRVARERRHAARVFFAWLVAVLSLVLALVLVHSGALS